MEGNCFSFSHCAIFLLLLLLIGQQQLVWSTSAQNHSIPALFVLGDSTVDPGNNNYIGTILKSNFPPYGMNFIDHIATGRFSDGKLVTDYLASYLGIKQLVPPYLDPTLNDQELLSGVSFAFAGSGYDPVTAHTSGVVPVLQQLNYVKECFARMENAVGKARAAKIVEDSVFVVSAGTNDFVISYYLLPSRRLTFSVEQYQQFILNQLQTLLKGLYELGARKFSFAGLPPLGCLPIVMTTNIGDALIRQCIDSLNTVAISYNTKLQKMLNEVQNNELKDAKILYTDVYAPLLDAIKNANKYGFEATNKGCCGTGFLEVSYLCNPLTPVCPDASSYVFWDSIHPTQRTYSILADSAKRGLNSLL